MKKYRVNVNGEEFEVSIEEVNAGETKTKLETKVEKTTPETKATPVNKNDTEDIQGEEIAAALPGTITSIEINVGDSVSEGDVLFIHEAMKMENEITTPVSGTVKAIKVSEGENVDTDQVLAVIG